MCWYQLVGIDLVAYATRPAVDSFTVHLYNSSGLYLSYCHQGRTVKQSRPAVPGNLVPVLQKVYELITDNRFALISKIMIQSCHGFAHVVASAKL